MDVASRVFVLGSYVSATCLRVDRLPAPGESLLATGCISEPGGKGLNLAVAARRLGARVDVLIPAGQDAEGDALAALLAAEGLPEQGLLRLPVSSGRGLGLIDAGGENMIAVWRGANAHLSAAHVQARAAQIQAARIVCAQFELDDAPIEAAFEIARRRQITTLLNVAPYRPLSARLSASADVLVFNASEAARWLGIDPAALATPAGALDRLADIPAAGAAVVVTLGAHGAVARDARGQRYMQPGFPVQALDTTGAGDAFCAGLATALAENMGWPDSLRRAAACGAWVAQREGVLAALPGAADIRALLAG